MNKIRNGLAIIIGVVVGGVLNSVIIIVGSNLIPAPAGVDVNNLESIRASIHLYEVKHFVTPFLAHALGTLVGAMFAYFLAVSYRSHIAYVIGAVFLAGGIAAATMIPAPEWFIALDLIAAYIPMAWLAIYLGSRLKATKPAQG